MWYITGYLLYNIIIDLYYLTCKNKNYFSWIWTNISVTNRELKSICLQMYLFQKSILSPLRKVKIFYHKGHKGISQRTQVLMLQTNIFINFVPTLCSLWLKTFFGVDSIFENFQFLKIWDSIDWRNCEIFVFFLFKTKPYQPILRIN